MRVAVDLRCLAEGEAGGIALYTRELLTRLPAQLPGVGFVGLHTGLREPARVNFPVRSLRVPNKLLNASLACFRRPFLDQYVPSDVFFAPTPKYASVQPGHPFVVTVHDVSFLQHPSYFTFRQRVWHAGLRLAQLLQQATAVIAVSRHTADDVRHFVPAVQDRLHVVHSGVDHVPLGPHAPLPNLPASYILAFAPREARKNIAALRAAHARGLTTHRVPLVLVGSGAGPASASVVVLPYLRPEERWRVLANARVLAYPSVYEGFGFPPLEAMRLGVPVMAAHVTSIPEVVGDAALLVDPWDPADMARALGELVTDEVLRQRCIAAGRERSSAFTWDRAAADTARVLRLAYADRH